MEDALQHQLEQAMAEFTKQRQALEQTRDELTTMSVTVRSKDRVVEVTVGAQGEPTGMRFLNDKHRSMSGQQLASSVLEVLAVARQEVAGRVRAGFDAVAGGGLGVAGSGLENLDLDRLLAPLMGEGLAVPPPGTADRAASAKRPGGGANRAR
ncbi:YbaB/EbfC family nucleoid-associated protein [Streptomyces sp.]|uniref:YbaB/EbfC family nucleoid-associated protein n=1 Tax=Streptomyces sp. TaxID=1931 RepID=UPI002F3E6F3F